MRGIPGFSMMHLCQNVFYVLSVPLVKLLLFNVMFNMCMACAHT
jgi:hypothetical protein